ncbi:unnamed protein product [Amoebophrya sp. A120]|nr:unnamed protein product [Amoebophrya sp. A120]|eukprot:GSA120T00008868001.1
MIGSSRRVSDVKYGGMAFCGVLSRRFEREYCQGQSSFGPRRTSSFFVNFPSTRAAAAVLLLGGVETWSVLGAVGHYQKSWPGQLEAKANPGRQSKTFHQLKASPHTGKKKRVTSLSKLQLTSMGSGRGTSPDREQAEPILATLTGNNLIPFEAWAPGLGEAADLGTQITEGGQELRGPFLMVVGFGADAPAVVAAHVGSKLSQFLTEDTFGPAPPKRQNLTGDGHSSAIPGAGAAPAEGYEFHHCPAEFDELRGVGLEKALSKCFGAIAQLHRQGALADDQLVVVFEDDARWLSEDLSLKSVATGLQKAWPSETAIVLLGAHDYAAEAPDPEPVVRLVFEQRPGTATEAGKHDGQKGGPVEHVISLAHAKTSAGSYGWAIRVKDSGAFRETLLEKSLRRASETHEPLNVDVDWYHWALGRGQVVRVVCPRLVGHSAGWSVTWNKTRDGIDGKQCGAKLITAEGAAPGSTKPTQVVRVPLDGQRTHTQPPQQLRRSAFLELEAEPEPPAGSRGRRGDTGAPVFAAAEKASGGAVMKGRTAHPESAHAVPAGRSAAAERPDHRSFK